MSKNSAVFAASFRDPSGFVYARNGSIRRQVNPAYASEYEQLMQSGLYASLADRRLLVHHQEIPDEAPYSDPAHKILEPERVPFISYPYEWSFSQLKDAALLTLAIEKLALEHGMSLKDASSYNVQFRGHEPVFIDTLSFEIYDEGTPWVAYKQFCQHFLAPLALMAHTDISLGQLLRVHIDGIPLEVATRLLPARTKLSLTLATHLHLHAKAQQRYAGENVRKAAKGRSMSKMARLGIVDNLEKAVKSLKWQPADTVWGDYYSATNYSDDSFEHKKQLVAAYLDATDPSSVWDLGANTGVFSRLASEREIPTIAFDIDPAAVEKNYLDCRSNGEAHLLPLLMDLTNPSPALGWECTERDGLITRGPADTALALALVHHLAIANNVPLRRVAQFFVQICRSLIVEFIPKQDSQVERLLASREDIFPDYTRAGFEAAFSSFFKIERAEPIRGSERTLYLMKVLQ